MHERTQESRDTWPGRVCKGGSVQTGQRVGRNGARLAAGRAKTIDEGAEAVEEGAEDGKLRRQHAESCGQISVGADRGGLLPGGDPARLDERMRWLAGAEAMVRRAITGRRRGAPRHLPAVRLGSGHA